MRDILKGLVEERNRSLVRLIDTCAKSDDKHVRAEYATMRTYETVISMIKRELEKENN